MNLKCKITLRAKEEIKKISPELFNSIVEDEKKNNGFSFWTVSTLVRMTSILRQGGFNGTVAEDVRRDE